jgi:hypothetical protein
MTNTITDISGNRQLTEGELYNYFEQQEYMFFIRNKIDSDIGYNYWKNYIVSAFWSNIATPLNLTITFLTAITTAQSQNNDLLPQQIYSNITIINLVITTLITFFRPHEQYSIYSDYVKRWVELGVDLEKEFSSKAAASDNNNVKLYHLEKQKIKITTYKNIQDKSVELRKSENNSIINSVTDFVFLIVYYLCMCRLYHGPKKWLDYDRKIHDESYREIENKRKQMVTAQAQTAQQDKDNVQKNSLETIIVPESKDTTNQEKNS